MPDIHKRFFVFLDSCALAVVASLTQLYGDSSNPAMSASRQLTDQGKVDPVGQPECLAICFAVTRFSMNLLGAQFKVCTDHKGMSELKSSASSQSSRLLRWSLLLQNYQFDVKFVSGKQNILVDYLSITDV